MKEMTATAEKPRIIPNPSFLHEVEAASGEKVSTCYLCQKCSSGCPVTFAMDILPHQIIEMIQIGLKDEVLQSSTIWVCSDCQTCTTRCPNDIDVAKIMDHLRQIAITSASKLGEKRVPSFHSAFLTSIKSRGRIHELGMLLQYKRKSGEVFQDLRLGWELFKRGKIRLLPARVRKTREIKGLFKKVGRMT